MQEKFIKKFALSQNFRIFGVLWAKLNKDKMNRIIKADLFRHGGLSGIKGFSNSGSRNASILPLPLMLNGIQWFETLFLG